MVLNSYTFFATIGLIQRSYMNNDTRTHPIVIAACFQSTFIFLDFVINTVYTLTSDTNLYHYIDSFQIRILHTCWNKSLRKMKYQLIISNITGFSERKFMVNYLGKYCFAFCSTKPFMASFEFLYFFAPSIVISFINLYIIFGLSSR
jgi:hypothetical protein